MKIATLFILYLFSVTILFAQKEKTAPQSFQLQQFLKTNTNPNELVSFFVKGTKIENNLIKQDGILKGAVNNWKYISLPKNKITAFLNQAELTAINFRNYQGTSHNDTMRVNNRINAAQSGEAPLNIGYSGKDIILGFIDTGIDWKHPDFRNPTDSSTRILAIWDQTKPVNQFTPSQYGYGQDWDSTEIMQELSTNNDIYGHGSTVAGAACGNAFANGLNKGVAPKADLIVVESNFNVANWLSTVADAVEYIYHLADSLNKPCVINASLGTYLGSHDGLDPYTLYIDSLINSKKGHLMVASAGNSGEWGKYHLHTEVTNDTTFTWFQNNPSSSFGNATFFEIWADTSDFNNVLFTVGADKISPSFENRGKGNYFNINTNLGGVNYDTIWNSSQQELATVQYWSEERDGQYLLQVYLPNPDSSQYNFRFETVGTGSFDCWSSSILGISNMVSDTTSILNFSENNKYVMPDSLKTIVSSFQCSPYVITVGNYWNDSGYVNLDTTWTSNGGVRGQIVASSSKGPTRDNRLKPEIAASGHGVNSAIPFHIINYYLNNATLDSTLAIGGMHRRNGGTSMASPIVAGVGALLLEKCNKMTALEFKAAITNNAYADNFTGTLPNNHFGYGKLDGFNTLLNYNYQNQLVGNLSFCENDSSLISLSNTVEFYNWNDSDTLNFIYASQSNQNFVLTIDTLGCQSDTLFFESIMNPIPEEPILTTDFEFINATAISNNQIQWFLNGGVVVGELDSTLLVTQNGDYNVVVTNQYGCENYSDTLYYGSVGILALENKNVSIYPNPATNYLEVKANEEIKKIELYSLEGKLIELKNKKHSNTTRLDLSKIKNGTYFIKLYTINQSDVKKIVIKH